MIEHTKVLGNPKNQLLKFSSSSIFLKASGWNSIVSYLFCDPLYEAHRNLKYFALLADRKMSFVEFLSRTFWIEMLNIISKY